MRHLFLLTILASFALLRSVCGETSLTIYNNNFAIIRDILKLDLKAGVNDVRYSDVALFAEPSSVILRDPTGKAEFQIEEQAFRGSAVTEETMLAWFEGQTIVQITREFTNSTANHLGVPLPAGRMRFFRRTANQELEFIGEYDGPGTAANEMVQAMTGFAFDLVGERRRTDFIVDVEKHTATESFEVKLRNHKKQPVEIRVVEGIGRWNTWEISAKSDPFTKKDAHTIEFNIPVKAGEERKLSFTVLYTKLPSRNDSP